MKQPGLMHVETWPARCLPPRKRSFQGTHRRRPGIVRDVTLDEARAEVKKIPASASLDSNSFYALAMTHQWLGDTAAELRYLAQAVKSGYSTAELANDPDLVALRRDPRYHLEVLPKAKATE